MKHKLFLLAFVGYVLFGCSSYPESKKYFVRSCSFVCNYPFNDTSKYAVTCRVWGLLKYYHPNVAAGKVDWDKVLLDRLLIISDSKTPEQVNSELMQMVQLAGKYQYSKNKVWNDSLNMNMDLSWMDHSFLDEPLKDELKKIASLPVKHPSYYGMGIDTARRSFMPQHEILYQVNNFSLFEYRLLVFFRYWNVIYYFYPHKYLMDLSWDQTLSVFIFKFINATNQQSFQSTFLQLATFLNDGHGYLSFANYYSNESQNIIEKIDEKTVVRIDAGGVRKGDIVKYIEKRDIDIIRDSLSALISSSTEQNKEYRINCYLADMIFFKEIDFTVLRNGQELNILMKPDMIVKKQLYSYQRISDNIGYVDLSVLTTKQIDSMFLSFSDTKGIIFDLRRTGLYDFDRDLLYCHLSNQKFVRLFDLVVWDFEHPGAYRWVNYTKLGYILRY